MHIIDDPTVYRYASPKHGGAAAGYVVKRIVSGPIIEYEIFPAMKKPPPGVRCRKAKPTSKKLKSQNEKNARKMFTRLLNANFGEKDIHFTGTINNPSLTIEKLKKISDNFISRWQYARKKAGLHPGKYMCVLERGTERMKRLHAHFILEGGLPRKLVEEKWKQGRTSCDYLQPDEFGLEGLGRYLMKDPKGRKRWYASRNLKRPKVTISHMKKSEAERIARNEHEAEAYFRRRDKKTQFNAMAVSYSDIVPGAYIHVITRRIE